MTTKQPAALSSHFYLTKDALYLRARGCPLIIQRYVILSLPLIQKYRLNGRYLTTNLFMMPDIL
jgi:hypothetical protein